MLLPDTTYMVTKRCSERRFFLTPSAVVNQIFSYCLAFAAQQTNVNLHAWTVLSNHWHAIVTDPDVELPEFMALVDRLVATCMNVHLRRFESFWSSEPYSAVRLEDEAAVLDKILYVLENPVAAGLVESNSQWPGLTSGPRACAQPAQTVKRPAIYFDPLGVMPDELSLEATVLLAYSDMTPQQFATMLAKKLKGREKKLLTDHAADRRSPRGADAVKMQDPFDCPKTARPFGEINPRVASRSKWRQIEALQQIKEFLDAYLDAWRDFQQGNKDVLFPAGTYWMRRHAGCEAAVP